MASACIWPTPRKVESGIALTCVARFASDLGMVDTSDTSAEKSLPVKTSALARSVAESELPSTPE